MVVYGDYECPFCAAFDARLAELAVRICFRHFPVRTLAPARPRGRLRGRGGSPPGRVLGRCTTRCSPTRAGSRTRTCGRARSGSGSTSSASTPIAARTRSIARVKAGFREGVRAGVATTPTAFIDGEIFPGRTALERLEVVSLDD